MWRFSRVSHFLPSSQLIPSVGLVLRLVHSPVFITLGAYHYSLSLASCALLAFILFSNRCAASFVNIQLLVLCHS